MEVGEKIYSSKSGITYTIFYPFKAGGQAEVAYATSSHSNHVFFIKRLLNIKYSKHKHIQKECERFETTRNEIYKKINSMTLDGATCPYVHDFFREGSFYYVVSRKIDGFSFSASDISKYLTLDEKLFLCRTIAYSLYPLEKQGIIHGDIKPDNFILKKKDKCFISNMVDLESSFLLNNPPAKGYIIGTEPYYSPELVDYNDEDNLVDKNVLSAKSDVFSLGVVFYELLTGTYPKISGKEVYAFEAVKHGEKIPIPETWPKALRTLILSMLDKKPSNRPTIMEILQSLKSIKIDTKPISGIHSPYVVVSPTADGKAEVSLYSLQLNSEIVYSLDGGPCILYEHPFIISDDDLVLKIKVSLKDNPHEIKEFTHEVSASINKRGKVARPVVKINRGSIQISSSTSGVEIYYTLNGDEPTKKANRYRSPFSVPENTVIKVVAYKKGMHSSDVVSINSSSKIKIS